MAEGQTVGRISIKVTPDTSKFRQQLKAQLESIEKTVRGAIRVDVDIDSGGAVARMRTLMTQLQAQAADGVSIRTDVNRSVGDQLQNVAARLTNVGDSAGYASREFLGLSRTGWIAAGVFSAAAPAVGLVAGLLAGLPSLISAFGSGAGAVALGLDGIKAAASGLAPQLDSLKASVSGVFEAKLTPIFDQLGTIFPVLDTGMRAVANGLSDMMQGFTNVVTSAGGMAQISTVLANTGSFLSGLAPIVGTATQAFLTLSTAGSNAFGYLQGSLATFATGFNDMVNRITNSGAFDGAMKGLSQTLDSVLSLFNRLFESGVTAMGQLGGPLSTLVNGIGDAFIAAMPALTAFSTLIGNVLGSALSALAPAISALTPAFTTLAETLGTMLTSNLQALAPVLTQVASAVGTTLLTALQALQPIMPQLLATFQQFGAVLSTQLAQYLPPLAQAFGQLLAAIIPLTPAFLKLVTEAIIPMVPAFFKLVTATTPLVTALAKMATVVSPLVQAFAAATPAIAGLISPITAVSGAFTALTGSIGTVIAKVAEWVSAFASAAVQVVSEAKAIPGKIQSALGNLGGVLVGAGKALMDGLLSGIRSGLQAVLDFASGIADKIAAVKGPLPYDRKVLQPAGEAMMHGLHEGLDRGFALVLDRAHGMGEELRKAFGPGDTGADWNAEFSSLGKDFAGLGIDFAKANASQFASDLGIGGQGALSQALQQGLQFGEQFVFNVLSMDDALSGQQRIQNKKSLQYVNR